MRSKLLSSGRRGGHTRFFSTSTQASDVLFTGNLPPDDSVQPFKFSFGMPSTVTARSYACAGETQADGDHLHHIGMPQ